MLLSYNADADADADADAVDSIAFKDQFWLINAAALRKLIKHL